VDRLSVIDFLEMNRKNMVISSVFLQCLHSGFCRKERTPTLEGSYFTSTLLVCYLRRFAASCDTNGYWYARSLLLGYVLVFRIRHSITISLSSQSYFGSQVIAFVITFETTDNGLDSARDDPCSENY
jgi:hypothetical protein